MDPFSLCYSDNNKENTFNNGGNNGHELQNATCKETSIKSGYFRLCVIEINFFAVNHNCELFFVNIVPVFN